MLTTEEINEIEHEAAHYPRRDAVSIDALKIVQRHRGWVWRRRGAGLAPHGAGRDGRRRRFLSFLPPHLSCRGRPEPPAGHISPATFFIPTSRLAARQ